MYEMHEYFLFVSKLVVFNFIVVAFSLNKCRRNVEIDDTCDLSF
jgi:hypothetical protein